MRLFQIAWVALATALPVIACGQPVITAQPASQTANEGSSISLIVRAIGSRHLTYQWRLAGQELPGQTRPNLGLRILQATDAGLYSVVVSDSDGAVTSEDAALSDRRNQGSGQSRCDACESLAPSQSSSLPRKSVQVSVNLCSAPRCGASAGVFPDSAVC